MGKAGTPANSATFLRLKAAEFLRLATEAHDPAVVEELHRLAQRYMDRARELDGMSDRPKH
jgi:hypothetical protein